MVRGILFLKRLLLDRLEIKRNPIAFNDGGCFCFVGFLQSYPRAEEDELSRQ